MFIHSMKTDPRYDNDTADNVIDRHRLVKQDYGPDQKSGYTEFLFSGTPSSEESIPAKTAHDGKDSQTSHRNYIIKYKFRRKRLKLTGIFDKKQS